MQRCVPDHKIEDYVDPRLRDMEPCVKHLTYERDRVARRARSRRGRGRLRKVPPPKGIKYRGRAPLKIWQLASADRNLGRAVSIAVDREASRHSSTSKTRKCGNWILVQAASSPFRRISRRDSAQPAGAIWRPWAEPSSPTLSCQIRRSRWTQTLVSPGPRPISATSRTKSPTAGRLQKNRERPVPGRVRGTREDEGA